MSGPSDDLDDLEGTAILFAPFILIPASILTARSVKYLYKSYLFKKFGLGDDILPDHGIRGPTSDTPILLEKTKEMKKIEKEQKMLELEKKKLETQKANPQETSSLLASTSSAEQYLEALKKKTKNAWYSNLSPHAIRKFLDVSSLAKWWLLLQMIVTLMAITNYVFLTYLANNDDINERNLIKNLDLIYASVFLADYILSFYIAEDRLKFYASAMSLIDLMSIVSPFVYLFVVTPTKYIWFVGFIRIFRAVRILRIYKLLSFAQSETTRELTVFALNFFTFVFFSTSLINATEAMDFSIDEASLKNWHDSLYYIIGTFSTTGSDIVPSSSISRAIVMILTISAIIYIPWQTSKIIEIYNSLNIFQRARYNPRKGIPHVILTGNIQFSTIRDFCREFFHLEEETTIVIVHTLPPSTETRAMLNHPHYRSRIFYLQGDIKNKVDMQRAHVEIATALFILTQDTGGENIATSFSKSVDLDSVVNVNDTYSLLISIHAKTHFPGLPIFAQLNEKRCKDLEQDYGIERSVCFNEFKSSIMARACFNPGLIPLLLNMIHTCTEESIASADFWLKEYHSGLLNQIASMEIPTGFNGVAFSDVSKELFTSFNAIIIAVKKANSKRDLKFKVPKTYRFEKGDVIFLVSDSSDDTLMRIAFRYREFQRKQALEERDLEIEMSEKYPSYYKTKNLPNWIVDQQDVYESHIQFDSSGCDYEALPPNLTDHVILSGISSSKLLLLFLKSFKAKCHVPIIIIIDRKPGRNEFWMEILGLGSVFITIGHITQPHILEKSQISTCKRVCLFSEGKDAQTLYLVKLIRKRWPNVNYTVELIDGASVNYFSSKTWEYDSSAIRMESVIDNCSLNMCDRKAYYRSLRTKRIDPFKKSIFYELWKFMFPTSSDQKENEAKSIIKPRTQSQIQKSKNVLEEDREVLVVAENQVDERNNEKSGNVTDQFLQKALNQSSDSSITSFPLHHFDANFAAGTVYSSSFLQSLLCQAYVRPYIVDILLGLIENVEMFHISPSAIGKPYIDLVDACLCHGYTPLALYRKRDISGSLSYVYTNPATYEIVNSSDMILAIKTD